MGRKSRDTRGKKTMASQRSEANLASGFDVPDEDVLRARIYAILAHLLTRPPPAETLESVRALEGDETEMGGALGALADVATQKEFFDADIRPWAARFFEDLEAAKPAVLYRPVGTVGRVFMAIEAEAFAMGA